MYRTCEHEPWPVLRGSLFFRLYVLFMYGILFFLSIVDDDKEGTFSRSGHSIRYLFGVSFERFLFGINTS